MAEIIASTPTPPVPPQPVAPTQPPVVPPTPQPTLTPPPERPGYLDYEHPSSRSKGKFILLLIGIIGVLGLLAFMLMTYMTANQKSATTTTPESVVPAASGEVPESFESGPPQDIFTPKVNEVVTSPLTITGVVPPGWMFEGIMPIKLVDENENVIAEGAATEDEPGSWQSGKRVKFTAVLNFETTAASGIIVIEKDNPSGLPENSGSIEQTVRFVE
jgi:hypothetical protein